MMRSFSKPLANAWTLASALIIGALLGAATTPSRMVESHLEGILHPNADIRDISWAWMTAPSGRHLRLDRWHQEVQSCLHGTTSDAVLLDAAAAMDACGRLQHSDLDPDLRHRMLDAMSRRSMDGQHRADMIRSLESSTCSQDATSP